jgi:hypothetical protein
MPMPLPPSIPYYTVLTYTLLYLPATHTAYQPRTRLSCCTVCTYQKHGGSHLIDRGHTRIRSLDIRDSARALQSRRAFILCLLMTDRHRHRHIIQLQSHTYHNSHHHHHITACHAQTTDPCNPLSSAIIDPSYDCDPACNNATLLLCYDRPGHRQEDINIRRL